MTRLGKLLTLFPVFNVALVLASLIGFVVYPGVIMGVMVLFFVYGFPLFCFHLHQRCFPLKEGISNLAKGYSPWYGTHMIQTMHITMPLFERILRLIPGAFSLWLRLWGSNIGKNVYWTPMFELMDRSLMEIGDNCVVGFNVKISCHVINPHPRRGLMLYVKRVRFGCDSFIGAECRLGPGATVADGDLLPVATDLSSIRRASATPDAVGITAAQLKSRAES